jgi:hypothetical protein
MWGDAMDAKINFELLKAATFDSGALGPLTMVLHQFRSDGNYRAAVTHAGRAVAEVTFQVEEKSESMQLDIDLARVEQAATARVRDCCSRENRQAKRVVSPKGYVLFHASSGYGYSVVASDDDGNVAFDSTKLAAGDLFAVSFIEPTSYSMVNKMGSASGEILVTLTRDAAKRIKNLETRSVQAGKKNFEASRIEVSATQGLVFHVKDLARIEIRKKEAAGGERARPVIRWRRPRPAEKGASAE